MLREGSVEFLCEGAAYSGLQSTNREVSVEVMKEHFRRAGREGEELTYLDLFCGTGIRALLFCEAFPQHGKVIGIDNNPKCIERAAQNASINQSAVEFLCHDVLSFPCESYPPFDVIEMDPFGGCLPYLEYYIPHLKEGGLLALTFTNSRELFPSAHAAHDDSSSYETHGISRPHPDIGAHEFGLRATWLAVSRKLASMSKSMTPVCSWAFQHGCRIMVVVSHSSFPKNPIDCVSLYVDASNSFAITFPDSVQVPSLNLCVSPEVTVNFVGQTCGHSMLDEQLISSVLQRSESSSLHSLLERLLQASSVYQRSSSHISSEDSCESLWGVYARKKFLQSYLSWGNSGFKKIPSLEVVCRVLSGVQIVVSLPQDQDCYLTSVQIQKQLKVIEQQFLLPKIFMNSVKSQPRKRARVEYEELQRQQPSTVSLAQAYSETTTSDIVFPILESMMTDKMSSGSEDTIQRRLAQLRDALFEFDPQPPVGFHHCVEILVVCSSFNMKVEAQSMTASPFLESDSCKVECKISLLESLESCLRVMENKQHRLRKRLQKRHSAADLERNRSSETTNHGPNRRARRLALQEAVVRQKSDQKLTTAIPHYVILFLPNSSSQSVSHNYQIFLGDEIKSSCTILGKIVPKPLASLIWKFWSLHSEISSSDDFEPTNGFVTVLMKGSIQFSTFSSSLSNTFSVSPLLIEKILFNVPMRGTQKLSPVISLKGAGLRCTILQCRMEGFLEQLDVIRLYEDISFVEVTRACDCRIMNCELSGFVNSKRSFQSLITCSCKGSLNISHSKLSFSEQSCILVHPSCHLVVDSCLIEHSKKSGLFLSDPAAVWIRDSEISRNGKCGVEIFSNGFVQSPGDKFSNVLLENCQIRSNLQSGVLLFNTFCSITSCQISRNGFANLSCQQGSRVLLKESTLSHSTRSGLHACGSGTVVHLSENTFLANQEGDTVCLGEATVDRIEIL